MNKSGAIERKHRHITKMGFLPIKLWEESFVTAIHVINALPTLVLQNKSPHEILFKEKSDYTRFKVFGCACYPLLRPYNKHKLDFRSSYCLFLGYTLNSKGYIYLSQEGNTYVSHSIPNNAFTKYKTQPEAQPHNISHSTFLKAISNLAFGVSNFDILTAPPSHSSSTSNVDICTEVIHDDFNALNQNSDNNC